MIIKRSRFLAFSRSASCAEVMGYEAFMLRLHTTAILCRFIKQSFKDIPGIDHGAASDVMYAVLFICRLLMISKDRLGGTAPEWRRLSGGSHQP